MYALTLHVCTVPTYMHTQIHKCACNVRAAQLGIKVICLYGYGYAHLGMIYVCMGMDMRKSALYIGIDMDMRIYALYMFGLIWVCACTNYICLYIDKRMCALYMFVLMWICTCMH